MVKIDKPKLSFEIDKRQLQRDQQQKQQYQQRKKQNEQALNKTKSLFDHSVNNHAKQNKQLQKDIQIYNQTKKKQENNPKLAKPVFDNLNQVQYAKINIQQNKKASPKLAKAKKEYQQRELQQQKNRKQHHRIKRIVRGSSSIIRKYDVNPSVEHLNRVTKSNLLNVYTNRLVHFINGGWGKHNLVQHHLANNRFYNSTNKIYTQDAVKMPLVLYSFPDELPFGWLDDCRDYLETVKLRYNRETNMNLQVSLNRTVKADNSDFSFVNSKKYHNDYDWLVKQYQENAQIMNDDKLSDREKKKALGDDIFRKLSTYEWVKDIETNDDDSLWRVYEFLEIVVSGASSTQTEELLHQCYDMLVTRLSILGIKYKDLYEVVQDYYDGFSPVGHGEQRKNYLFRKYLPNLRCGQQVVGPTNLRQGSISDEYGVPVGIDIYGESPLYIDYSNNNLQPSTLIAATTGHGKTYFVQSLIMGFLLFPELYFPIIIDWKNEYVDLGRKAGMQIISSSPSDGLYFSTIEIPAATGDPEIDEHNKDNALRTTENIFEILLGKELWSQPGIQTAFEFVRNSLYRNHGVYLDDPTTWVNSKGLNFHTFYAEINRIMRNERAQAFSEVTGMDQETQASEVFRVMKEKLAPYFKRNGSRNNFFKKAIRMDDINNSHGLIFALDREQEKGGSDEDTRLQLSMQFILHIINNLTNQNKDNKRLLTLFFEETNRLLQLPRVAEMMSGFASSGRSRGIRNFFITNAPGQIFNLGDKVRGNSRFAKVDPGVIQAIIANIGSVIVGANSQHDMVSIVKHFNLTSENQLSLIKLLAEDKNLSNDDSNIMRHKFLIQYSNKTTLIEAISYPTLDELNIFGTSVDVKPKHNREEDKEKLMNDLMNDKGISQPNEFNVRKDIQQRASHSLFEKPPQINNNQNMNNQGMNNQPMNNQNMNNQGMNNQSMNNQSMNNQNMNNQNRN